MNISNLIKIDKLKNMEFKVGIRLYLASGIVILTISAIAFIGLFTLKLIEDNAVYRKVKEAELIGRFLQVAAERDVAGNKTGIVDKTLRAAHVFSAIVVDRNGKVLLEKGKMPVESGRVLLFTGGVKIRKVGGGLFGVGESLYVHVSLKEGSNLLGNARFIISLGEVSGYMKEVRSFIAGYAVIDSLIIILVAVYFLSQTVVWPLRRLEKAATRISKGNFSERVEVVGTNELATLAGAFNVMAERLEEEINRLERVNKELVETQDELLQTSTLAAVGRLSAGIAHELGNPLGAVLGYLEILSKDIDDKDLEEEDKKEIFSRTENEIERINTIVSEFLSLLREPKMPKVPIDINKSIGEVIEAMKDSKGFSGVKVRLDLKNDLPHAMIDGTKLKQVLINIFVNSADAIGRDGFFEIKTAVVGSEEIDSKKFKSLEDEDRGFEAQKKNFVLITFRDEGVGISEEDSGKVFEPFYTTKDIGKGTGLGLFVSNTIVEMFGGFIDFKSVKGEYTEFYIFLPVSQDSEL